MAYDQGLAQRISDILYSEHIQFEEKKMFGGLAFMIAEKMCVGIIQDELMLRVVDEKCESVLAKRHAKPMMFTGRPMKNFLSIEPAGFKTEKQLRAWIDYAIEFGKYGVVKTKKKT